MNDKLIDNTIAFVKQELAGAEAGHDWSHIERVYNNTLLIARTEMVDKQIVILGSLLHDIADAKFHNGDEELGPLKASQFLLDQGVNETVVYHVVQIIKNISFKNSLDTEGVTPYDSIELQVVRDADRLDAIGAIGIARCFNFGGYKNNRLYDYDIKPNLNMTKEEYKKSNTPTINHFYEKLLLLKDLMHTETGKKMAEVRHDFMLSFLDQFKKETGFSKMG